MPNSTQYPASSPPNAPNNGSGPVREEGPGPTSRAASSGLSPGAGSLGGSRLRTVVGNRYPRKCASCHETILVGPDVKSVVDFGAPKPYPAYHAEHSPDAGRFRGRAPRAEEAPESIPGFAPARLPPAPPAPPPPPKSPASPPPLALLGSTGNADATPNPAAGVPWATASLTLNAGSFESARAGLADYAQSGETCEQLRARISRLVLEDLERSVRAMRDLHERLGDTPTRTTSPGLRAGAPQGASATPFGLTSQASPLSEPSVPRSSPPFSASAPSPGSGVGTAGGGGAPARPCGL